jgi:DnaJ-domain-containing protein 1
LGDVLGTLLRGRATGFLELGEARGPRSGKRHFVFLTSGRPSAVVSDGPALGEILRRGGAVGDEALTKAHEAKRRGDARLTGELLCDLGSVDLSAVERGMAEQTRTRLDRLFALREAELRFHATRLGDGLVPLPLRAAFGAPQLGPEEFLFGRPRKRPRSPRALDARRDALALLGVDAGATREDVRKAFKRLALELHPDRAADGDERRTREARLARVTAAYALLTR